MVGLRPADEGAHEVVCRSGQNLFRRAALRDFSALAEHDDFVAQAERLFDVVRHEDDRFADLPLQTHELVLKLAANDGVDGAEGLVHEQDLGLGGQSPRHAHTLALAPGKLSRVSGAELRVEPHPFEKLQRRGSGLTPRRAVEDRHGGDVVRDGAMRQEPAVLKHVSDGSAEFDGIGFSHVDAVDEHPSRRRVDHAVDHAQQRRLA